MQIAISRIGVIENLIEAQSVTDAQAIFPDADVFEANGVGIGWREIDGEWVAPVLLPVEPNFPTLTRRQLRLALLSINVTSADVEAQIASIENETDRAAAMIEWQDASSYERNHPLIAEVAASLELPADQVDALWIWASGL